MMLIGSGASSGGVYLDASGKIFQFVSDNEKNQYRLPSPLLYPKCSRSVYTAIAVIRTSLSRRQLCARCCDMEPFPALQTSHNLAPSPSRVSSVHHRRPRKSTGLGDGLPGDIEGPTATISTLVNRLPEVPPSVCSTLFNTPSCYHNSPLQMLTTFPISIQTPPTGPVAAPRDTASLSSVALVLSS